MSIHRIRLHKAWRLTPLTANFAPNPVAPFPAEGERHIGLKAEVGQSWSAWLGDFRGVARYERTFHPPSNLGEEQVFLVCCGFDATAHISLNGRELGLFSAETLPLRLDITHYLAPNSFLQIDVELPAADSLDRTLIRPPSELQGGGLTGMIFLEIVSRD
jgi:hypothetical protein